VILLWGLDRDGPLSAVKAELIRTGIPFVHLDQRRVLADELTLDIGDTIGGLLRTAGREVDLARVSAAYVRPYDSWRIGAVARAGRDSAEARHAAAFDDTLWQWAELSPALLVNRPSAMASNSSKPRQAVAIAAHGFPVPATLITTDPDAVREFRAAHGVVVYKSISGTRSIVSRLDDSHDERLKDLAWCPTQFQAYVPGDDHRVHVVGDRVFCSRIVSEAVDYRYGHDQGMPATLEPALLPAEWARRCRELTADLGFAIAGIDLRRTPAGEWYCFEVNPSPAFTFYDRHGEGMAGAVTKLLAGAGS
jgi:hypothetical protein